MSDDEEEKITFRVSMGKAAESSLMWLVDTVNASGLDSIVRVAFSWLHYTVRVLDGGGVIWVIKDGDVKQITMDDLLNREGKKVDKPEED